MNNIKIKFNISLSYIEPNKEDPINSKYTMNFNENYEVRDIKELKELISNLIDWNLEESKEWLDNIKQIVQVENKNYVEYNNLNKIPFYLGLRYGEDKEGNIIDIIRVEAYRITKKEAIQYVEVVNK